MAKRSFPSVFVSVFAAASITAIIMLITLGSFSQLQEGLRDKPIAFESEVNSTH